MALAKSVIFVEEKETEKPVEFTHLFINNQGWIDDKPGDFEKVVYLGNCKTDGDMFACYDKGLIGIYKGHLNSGKY
jgi:trehalose-6-phosphatase